MTGALQHENGVWGGLASHRFAVVCHRIPICLFFNRPGGILFDSLFRLSSAAIWRVEVFRFGHLGHPPSICPNRMRASLLREIFLFLISARLLPKTQTFTSKKLNI